MDERDTMALMDSVTKAVFSKHACLPEVGEEGQERLMNSKVLVVGAGGLGTPAITYLAGCGVGLNIVDHDSVSLPNLPRQVLYRHGAGDVGEGKAPLCAAWARDRLPRGGMIAGYRKKVTNRNVARLVRRHDLVVDCTDNTKTRRTLSDACLDEGVPMMHAAVGAWVGQIMLLCTSRSPCYRCLYRGDPTDKDGGVLAPITGVVGTLQAMEAIKFLLGMGTEVEGNMLMVDLRNLRMDLIRWAAPRCGQCEEKFDGWTARSVSE